MAVDLKSTSQVAVPKEVIINLVISVTSIVLVIVLWIVVVNPRYSQLVKLEKKIKSVSRLSEKDISASKKKKEKLLAEKGKLEREITAAKNKLRQTKDISSLLDRFNATAKKRKLEFTYIKPLKEKNKVLEDENISIVLREVPVKLRLEAGFSEFLGFLWESEHGEQIFEITDLTIERNRKDPVRHKESMTLSVYRLMEED